MDDIRTVADDKEEGAGGAVTVAVSCEGSSVIGGFGCEAVAVVVGQKGEEAVGAAGLKKGEEETVREELF